MGLPEYVAVQRIFRGLRIAKNRLGRRGETPCGKIHFHRAKILCNDRSALGKIQCGQRLLRRDRRVPHAAHARMERGSLSEIEVHVRSSGREGAIKAI